MQLKKGKQAYHNRHDSSSTSSEIEETPQRLGKFKTELCRKWENGNCEFKDRCMFAHGHHELRSKKIKANYKTKKCTQFFEKGYCVYGYRCQFSHQDTENKPVASTTKKPSNEVKGRLPIFIDIECRNIY